MGSPADRFTRTDTGNGCQDPSFDDTPLADVRTGDTWVAPRAGANGLVSVSWQQVSIGKHRAGRRIDVHVGDQLLQFYDGNELLKTVTRTSRGEVRKKRASTASNEA